MRYGRLPCGAAFLRKQEGNPSERKLEIYGGIINKKTPQRLDKREKKYWGIAICTGG